MGVSGRDSCRRGHLTLGLEGPTRGISGRVLGEGTACKCIRACVCAHGGDRGPGVLGTLSLQGRPGWGFESGLTLWPQCSMGR